MNHWHIWRASASLTRNRLQRIIRNVGRFDDCTFAALLQRIDMAVARDTALLDAALVECDA